MADMVVSRQTVEAFPVMAAWLEKAARVFDDIRSFEDIERWFLQGAGLSPNTYKSYLCAVRLFYDWSGGRHPLQTRPADIEAFYDHMIEKNPDTPLQVRRNTAHARVCALKRFFGGVKAELPFFENPFDVMPERLEKKLNRTGKGRAKKAMTQAEVKRVLAFLKGQRRAVFFMLVSSGLRASELLQLRWGDLEHHEGKWTATFVAKGGEVSTQELYAPAVESIPGSRASDNSLFLTRNGPMSYAALRRTMQAIGKATREAGIIKRELQWSPHLGRRTYASLLEKGGMPISMIAKKTRHKSLDVLFHHYLTNSEPASPVLEAVLA